MGSGFRPLLSCVQFRCEHDEWQTECYCSSSQPYDRTGGIKICTYRDSAPECPTTCIILLIFHPPHATLALGRTNILLFVFFVFFVDSIWLYQWIIVLISGSICIRSVKSHCKLGSHAVLEERNRMWDEYDEDDEARVRLTWARARRTYASSPFRLLWKWCI